jgi:hypothetical protein
VTARREEGVRGWDRPTTTAASVGHVRSGWCSSHRVCNARRPRPSERRGTIVVVSHTMPLLLSEATRSCTAPPKRRRSRRCWCDPMSVARTACAMRVVSTHTSDANATGCVPHCAAHCAAAAVRSSERSYGSVNVVVANASRVVGARACGPRAVPVVGWSVAPSMAGCTGRHIGLWRADGAACGDPPVASQSLVPSALGRYGTQKFGALPCGAARSIRQSYIDARLHVGSVVCEEDRASPSPSHATAQLPSRRGGGVLGAEGCRNALRVVA